MHSIRNPSLFILSEFPVMNFDWIHMSLYIGEEKDCTPYSFKQNEIYLYIVTLLQLYGKLTFSVG